MPTWLLNWLLPLAIQVLTPILTELIKKLTETAVSKMSETAVVSTAAVIGEVVNQMQSNLTGWNLPYGASGLLAVLLNSVKNDWQIYMGTHPAGM